MPLLKVNKISKSYFYYNTPADRLKESFSFSKKKYRKEFVALSDISFSLYRGETVGIIGKNGSGKSTFLKIIAGVLTQTSGNVDKQGSVAAILELSSGFNPEMTGRENINLNLAINNITDKTLVNKIINFSELDSFIDKPLKTYSSGMKARLGFSLAINISADILIVDEALSVGDVAFQQKCFQKIYSLKNEGTSILFVSHSEAAIMNLCDRVVWLDKGMKILEGDPKTITTLYMREIKNEKILKKNLEHEYNQIVKKNVANKKEVAPKKNFQVCNHEIESFYSKELEPKAKVSYAENGAKIENICIKRDDGTVVNVLVHNEEYTFEFYINLKDSIINVQTGMLIKNMHGVALSGGAFPSRNKYIKISTKRLIAKFRFKAIFNEGTYSMNCSIRSNDSGEMKILHKIVDCYLFKIIKNNEISTSIIDAMANAGIEQVC